jgi:uncharacterized protein (DUF2147 family)
MLKRNIVIAAVLVAAQSGAALADNNWAFDDAYWKNPARSGLATSLQAGENAVTAQFAKYRQVDGYNY